MSTYPRDLLTDEQVASFHKQFLDCNGCCDLWIDTQTQTMHLTKIGAEEAVFLARHMAAIEQGTIRLVQWE
jgi:hypothetical protein